MATSLVCKVGTEQLAYTLAARATRRRPLHMLLCMHAAGSWARLRLHPAAPRPPPPPLQQCDTLLAGVKEAQQHNEVTG